MIRLEQLMDKETIDSMEGFLIAADLHFSKAPNAIQYANDNPDSLVAKLNSARAPMRNLLLMLGREV